MDNEINIPATVEDMNISHLPFLLKLRELQEKENITVGDITRMCANFTGIPIVKMRRYPKSRLQFLFEKIVEVYGTYNPQPVPLTLEYKDEDGKLIKYNFITDFTKLPVDWYIDIDESDIEGNPMDLMCFCYIEDGMSYGEPDEHDNVLNPRSVRNKIFTENVSLDLYLDVQGFFLLNWNVVQKSSTEANRKRKANSKRK